MTKEFWRTCREISKNQNEKFRKEYEEFCEALETPSEEIPIYEWTLLSCYASEDLEQAVKAVNDAYKLGFAAGKKSK